MNNVICHVLRSMLKRCRPLTPPPDYDTIKKASQDVAWEYATMLAAAREIAAGDEPGSSMKEAFLTSPTNHLVQEAFLVHVRNLAEFFREGVREFKKAQGPPPRPRDNIYAVDFCLSVGWQAKPFARDKQLIRAINKTLSHMTYSRDRAAKGHAHFEGREHVHGTVKLMRRTWADFVNSMRPEFLQPQCPQDIHFWLADHTKDWRVRFGDLESEFEIRAQRRAQDCKWTLNQTPDGPV